MHFNIDFFITFLEEHHHIEKLDLYVIDEICQMLRQQLDLNNVVVPVSFNLSRYDFLYNNIFDKVEEIVKKHNIDRKYLYIEITESTLVDNISIIKNEIKKFRSAGYQIWMDDFGNGYSSLHMLKDFDFDEIKIDQSFLRNFDERSKIVISSIVKMANQLNINTLAEGIETQEQHDFLCSIGCKMLQGFYLYKPMPLDELLKILNKN